MKATFLLVSSSFTSAPRPVDALEERRLRVLEGARLDVVVQARFGEVVRGHVVAVPTFSCSRSHPRRP